MLYVCEKWVLASKIFLVSLLILCSCSKDPSKIQFNLIQPTGGHCQYKIGPATITTLQNLKTMQGVLGRVVYSEKVIDVEDEQVEEQLVEGKGFSPLDTQFAVSGSTYTPANMSTLFGVSLYWAIEQTHLLMKGYGNSSDVTRIVEDLDQTTIIHEVPAIFQEGGDLVSDNAAFLGLPIVEGGNVRAKNYFLSFPTNAIKEIPLGMNLGVMAHEFVHFLSFHMYRLKLISDSGGNSSLPTVTSNTIKALDEGIADYFGFLVSGDPGFLLCSLPSANRDVSVRKIFTRDLVNGLNEPSNDPHKAGAVFAALQYEIAKQTGDFQQHGKSLVQLLEALPNCMRRTGGQVALDFGTVRDCHLSVLGTGANRARSLYDTYYNGNF